VSDPFTNPFHAESDPDRHWIWQHLIAIDSDAFALGDWSMVEDDFCAERFEGIRCAQSTNPDDWTIAFATLAAYRESWLASSREFLQKKFIGLSHREAVYRRCRIDRIDINDERALVHKKFSGDVPLTDGAMLTGSRQTLYRLHRIGGGWKIVGFLGQLPLDEPS
jgi:hypothetical protein